MVSSAKQVVWPGAMPPVPGHTQMEATIMIGPDAGELAQIEAAFAAGYEAEKQRQQYGAVAIGWDPEPDPYRPGPAGLGYARAPRADAVFVADTPSLAPSVLPVPAAFDAGAPPSVTGSSHSWGQMPARGESVTYMGLGDAQPPRRSLWARLTGKGR